MKYLNLYNAIGAPKVRARHGLHNILAIHIYNMHINVTNKKSTSTTNITNVHACLTVCGGDEYWRKTMSNILQYYCIN